ncbi:hypothetical protein S7335_2197 [Synechococcus sp. PCC 7335]|nr:hypothetical protein S7335_2197 [Synechococcus sp. PCC 7335]
MSSLDPVLNNYDYPVFVLTELLSICSLIQCQFNHHQFEYKRTEGRNSAIALVLVKAFL